MLRASGSSPRMWGTQHLSKKWVKLGRFIPTHVGNTRATRQCTCQWPVHPHACGEHTMGAMKNTSNAGSSPRMWGTRLERVGRLLCRRFIPTHVGNTSFFTPKEKPPSVHPHACGEHNFVEAQLAGIAGSSPRMWGTRRVGRVGLARKRFIPTHVGNTPILTY